NARQNLLREGIAARSIHVTGNTVIDALFLALAEIGKHSTVIAGLPEFLQPERTSARRPACPTDGGGACPRVVLITGHRRENFGAGLEAICGAISELATRFPEAHFIYPVHLNPNVREAVFRILNDQPTGAAGGSKAGRKNIHLIDP